jgi:polyisoprenoid-binding protein YceI
VSKVRGRFDDFTVDAVVGHALETTTVAALIQLASVDTGNADRDAHVQAPDVVDVTTRPTMAFRSRHAGSEARGEIKRSDVGIAPAIPSAMVGDVVKFELDLQLIEPAG